MHKTFVRTGFALALAAASAAALAAEPATGTLTDTSGPLEYTAGPFVLPNPTPQLSAAGEEPVCEPATQTCDVYTLTVTLPEGYADEHPDDSVVIQVAWASLPDPTATTPDFDVYLYEGDKAVADAATGANPERIRLPVFNGTRTFEIRTITFAPAGASFTGTIVLEKFEEQSSGGLIAAGGLGLGFLAGLAGFGLLRRRGR